MFSEVTTTDNFLIFAACFAKKQLLLLFECGQLKCQSMYWSADLGMANCRSSTATKCNYNLDREKNMNKWQKMAHIEEVW